MLIHEIEEYSLKKGTIECRACTSNEKGVAYCSTCLSYLCGKCCQAHQYMKCFEHHNVRNLSNETTTTTTTVIINDKENHDNNNNKLEKQEIEEMKKDLNEKLNKIDKQRLNSLSNLDSELTSHQHDYDKTRIEIDLAHTKYQQILNQVYVNRNLLFYIFKLIFEILCFYFRKNVYQH